MKMIKKVFIIMAVVCLVLTMAGSVSAAQQSVDNETYHTKKDGTGNYTFPNSVKVTLNLEKSYIVVIPDDFILSTNSRTISESKITYYSTGSTGPELDFQITLLDEGANLTVMVGSPQYNRSFSPIVNDGNSDITGDNGAWKLMSEDDKELHYLMAVGTAHIIPSSNYNSNNVLPVRLEKDDGAHSVFFTNNSVCYRTNSSVKVKLHAAVIEKPLFVDTYTDQLTFTVKYEEPTS